MYMHIIQAGKPSLKSQLGSLGKEGMQERSAAKVTALAHSGRGVGVVRARGGGPRGACGPCSPG